MPASDYMASRLQDHWLGNTAFSPPATIYLAAFTSSPTPAGPGSGEVSTVSTGYSRVAVANNTTNFPAATSGNVKHLGINVDFPTATGSWGNVTHLALFDSSTGGNLLAYFPLTASTAIAATDTLRIPSGSGGLAIDLE